MKLSLVSFLALSACGGAPFTLNELSTDRPDADPGLEASAGDDAGPEAAEDAGQDAQEADPGDAAPDTKQDQDAAPDAQEPDSGAQDSGHKPDSGSSQPDSGSGSGDAGLACPGDLACNPAGSWPSGFCLIKSGTGNLDFTSPAACNTCSAYTCACVLANSPYVPGSGCSCSLVGGTVSIVCQ